MIKCGPLKTVSCLEKDTQKQRNIAFFVFTHFYTKVGVLCSVDLVFFSNYILETSRPSIACVICHIDYILLGFLRGIEGFVHSQ